jgi:hypothetical protein
MQFLQSLFTAAPVTNTDFVLGEIGFLVIFLVLLLLVPFAFNKLMKRKKPWLRLLNTWCKTLRNGGLVLLLFLFLRYETIYPFELRVWSTLTVLVTVGIGIWLTLRFRKTVPVNEKVTEERFAHYDRYLPQRKK